MTAERSKKIAGGKRSATTGELREKSVVIPEGSKNDILAGPAEFASPVFRDPFGIDTLLTVVTGGAPAATTG